MSKFCDFCRARDVCVSYSNLVHAWKLLHGARPRKMSQEQMRMHFKSQHGPFHVEFCARMEVGSDFRSHTAQHGDVTASSSTDSDIGNDQKHREGLP